MKDVHDVGQGVEKVPIAMREVSDEGSGFPLKAFQIGRKVE